MVIIVSVFDHESEAKMTLESTLPAIANVSALAASSPKLRDAIDLWLATFPSENTRRAYARELMAFTAFAGFDDPASAVAAFLALDDGPAHAVADKWRADKLARGLSPASINRSMAALNSLVAYARRVGLTKLRLEAKGEKSKPYRDTSGPGLQAVTAMIRRAKEHDNPRKAARDEAILRLAATLGLRRAEIAALNIGDVDLGTGTVSILGKGQRERIKLSLPPNVKNALSAWLSLSGSADPAAPLFVSLTSNQPEKRISGTGIYLLVRDQLGKRSGVNARPHGLRHTAITAALDAFNGDVRKARSFSRHANLATVALYDDARHDHAGAVAQVLDGLMA
jgi:integrase/recombinase XerC